MQIFRNLLALLLVGWFAGSAHANFDHRHQAWDALLKKHVVLIEGGNSSQLHYIGMQKDRAQLKTYLESLSVVRRSEFDRWTQAQRMAFLINAYNAFTVEKILTRYPDIGSIWDFGKLFGNPFKDSFFKLFGEDFSVDRIENEILRKPGAYDEPRVHFAINCASVGCPKLRDEAYVAERLGAQLEEQTRRFLSSRTRNRYNAADEAIEVSKIFDWYKEDWTSGYRGLDGKGPPMVSREQFFSGYADLLADRPEDQAKIRERKAKIRFLDYDWNLNDVKK